MFAHHHAASGLAHGDIVLGGAHFALSARSWWSLWTSVGVMGQMGLESGYCSGGY